MELAHVVGKTRALIEMLLDDEAAHAGRFGPLIQIQRIVGSRGLAVARSVAVGILIRVQVDAAVLHGGIGDDWVGELHRGPAATALTASLTGAGPGASRAAWRLLPANERGEGDDSDDDSHPRCNEPPRTRDTHGHILRHEASHGVTSPPGSSGSSRPTGCSASTRPG